MNDAETHAQARGSPDAGHHRVGNRQRADSPAAKHAGLGELRIPEQSRDGASTFPRRAGALAEEAVDQREFGVLIDKNVDAPEKLHGAPRIL